MSDNSFGVGIVGAGHIARVHARHLVRVPGARLAAVADLKREKAAAVAEASGAAGGAVGKPAAVRVRRAVSGQSASAAWYADPERGGGVLFDLLVHEFDWLLWCFGPVARVYAQSLTARLAAGAVSTDYALVTLRHA